LTSPKTILNTIISTLQEADSLSAIKHVLKGEPPQSKYKAFPFIFAEWNGGRQQPATTSNKLSIEDIFYIVVVDRHPSPTEAEDNIMDYAESIETALASDRTLNGAVAHSYVSNREKQKQFSSDYSVVAARITLSTYRRN